MTETITLAPEAPVTVQPGDSMRVALYLDPGVQITDTGGWTAGPYQPDAMYGTKGCSRQDLTHTAATSSDPWPTVTLDQLSWTAWTWYVGRPDTTEAGYSWPESATVTAAG